MRPVFGRFAKYTAVGVVNTFLYAALLFLFLKHVDMPKPILVAVAFLLAMSFQYFANRAFTFRSEEKISKELPKYFAAALVNYLITLLVVFVAIDILLVSEAWASILASLVTAISGYFLALIWVFK